MQDKYDVGEVIRHALHTGTDISPADRLEWKLFCCALKVLGYDENTFAALSSCSERDARKAWREERSPERYATEESAKAKIIALAKAAGIDLQAFRLSQNESETRPTPQHRDHSRGIEKPTGPTNARQRQSTPRNDNYIIPAADVDLRASKVRETALFAWLCKEFGEADATTALKKYRVGAANFTSPEGYYAAALPMINRRGECIDLKLMHFSPESGSRKNYFLYVYFSKGERREVAQSWAVAETNKKLCFDCRNTTPRPTCPGRDVCAIRKQRAPWSYFGEHLLSSHPEGSAVAVVESEKTALVASIVYPEFIWIATGSLNNLNPERFKPLANYAVTLFPDRDAADLWKAKARELARLGYNIRLDVTLHRYPGGPKDDLADIIINFMHGNYDHSTEGAGSTPAPDASTMQPPPTDEGEAARDADGNFIPWRFAVPQPQDPERLPEWLADRAAWRLELREQCRRCRYSQTLGGEFKGCRLKLSDEEAASRKECPKYTLKEPTNAT